MTAIAPVAREPGATDYADAMVPQREADSRSDSIWIVDLALVTPPIRLHQARQLDPAHRVAEGVLGLDDPSGGEAADALDQHRDWNRA